MPVTETRFRIIKCPLCKSEYSAPIGAVVPNRCPMCYSLAVAKQQQHGREMKALHRAASAPIKLERIK